MFVSKDHSDCCEQKRLERRPDRSVVTVQDRDYGNLVKKGHMWGWEIQEQATFEKARYEQSRRMPFKFNVSVTLESVAMAETPERESILAPALGGGRNLTPIEQQLLAVNTGRAFHEGIAYAGENFPSCLGWSEYVPSTHRCHGSDSHVG